MNLNRFGCLNYYTKNWDQESKQCIITPGSFSVCYMISKCWLQNLYMIFLDFNTFSRNRSYRWYPLFTVREHVIWLTLHRFPHISMWYCHSERTTAVSTTPYPFIAQQSHGGNTVEKVKFYDANQSLPQIVLTCWSKVSCGALTLLSMAPIMLGPWQCSRLSWLTGWWRIRFFTISKKAAILFLSSLPSDRKKG